MPSSSDAAASNGLGEPGPAVPEASAFAARGLTIANEFAEVLVRRVRTRNGVRLEIAAPRLGQRVLLCPLELEALTWQTSDTFSRLLSTPFGPEHDAAE